MYVCLCWQLCVSVCRCGFGVSLPFTPSYINTYNTLTLHSSDGTTRNPGMTGSTVRQCPLCRVPSFFVVPSIRTFTLKSLISANTSTGTKDTQAQQASQASLQAEKAAFIDAYKRSLKQKPCRYYLTEKSCPFGSSCFYLHIDASGEVERGPELDITSKPRYLLNAAGETVVLQTSVPKEAFKLPS